MFFTNRPEGPRNVGLDPAEVAASGPSESTGKGPVTGPIKYAVTMDGAQHHVTVERA